MKSALKVLVIIWACISLLSLAGLLYLLASYFMVGAFAQVFKTLQSPEQRPELARWFHFSELGLTVGIFMTTWLWRTHRKHYRRLWKSN
jgi:hypothetical protein